MSLQGKVAIVTGGNSGIGKAIALGLAKAGANIVIDYVAHPERPTRSNSEIAALGDDGDRRRGRRQQGRRPASVGRRGGGEVRPARHHGQQRRRRDPHLGPRHHRGRSTTRSSTINLKSAFFGTQIAAKQMIKQGGGGRIINITSVHEDWPMPGNTAYCLSKGGMRMLTRTAGVELAPHGILVVGVGPGAVATPINLSTMNDPALMKRLDAAIPLGRMAQPEEIANVVVFLAGDGASYLTATTIFADGGMMQSSVGL